jgi:hypothetical protein
LAKRINGMSLTAANSSTALGRQRRRHVEHRLAVREKLLREQIAEPTSGLDRPRPLLEPCRPRQQLVQLPWSRADLQLPELNLAAIDRARRVEQLVWIDPNHH